MYVNDVGIKESGEECLVVGSETIDKCCVMAAEKLIYASYPTHISIETFKLWRLGGKKSNFHRPGRKPRTAIGRLSIVACYGGALMQMRSNRCAKYDSFGWAS
jgi:hypothetical protein